jgi:hypothetical protein
MSDTAEILAKAADTCTPHNDAAGKAESSKERKQKAGHQEILGETLAKFEFFENGWDPYTRFLDIDKVDLVLRRRLGNLVEYRDVQVKYGKLYERMAKFEHKLFVTTSWRFFNAKELEELNSREGLYLAYVLSRDKRYRDDIFIFPINEFVAIVKQSVRSGEDRYKVYISKGHDNHWYVRRQGRKFETLDKRSVLDVSKHYRNFACLG